MKALDDQLKALIPALTAEHGLSIEPQADWFKRSRMCASLADHPACLRAAYRERIAIARSMERYGEGALDWKSLQCRKVTIKIAALDHGIYAIDDGARISLALAATELATWKPYVAISKKTRKLR